MRLLIASVCWLLLSSTAIAQTTPPPIESKNTDTVTPININFTDSGFTPTEIPLNLLFFDDFSYPGPPDPTKWGGVNRVLINNDMPGNAPQVFPPSYGVATFNGLDHKGGNHSDSPEKDDLKSASIDLSAYQPGDQVYLSFFLQQNGLGRSSSSTDKKLKLLFRKNQTPSSWTVIETFHGESGTNLPFEFYAFPINRSEFFHENFQFQFRAINSVNGNVDIWNLDDVRISTGGIPSVDIPDMAFAYSPAPLLKNYTSMPWREFHAAIDEEINPNLDISLYNNFAGDMSVSTPLLSLEENITNTLLIENYDFMNLSQFSVPANTGVHYENPIDIGVFNDLKNQLAGFDADTEHLAFEMIYNFQQADEPGDVSYSPVKRNNRISHTTIFKDYYAYDDGTAESYLILDQGKITAIKYHAHVEETISAISAYFTPESDDYPTKSHFYVWVGGLDAPPFRMMYQRHYFPEGHNQFHTYYLQNNTGKPNPITIPAGSDFYIGFWTPFSCPEFSCSHVGLDKNNEESAEQVYFGDVDGIGGNILSNFRTQNIGGVPMMRPVVEENWNKNMDIVLYPPEDSPICEDQDLIFHLTIDIQEEPGELPCTAPLDVYITAPEQNSDIFKTVSYNPVTQLHKIPVEIKFEEPGIKTITIRVQNECSFGYKEIEVNIGMAFDFPDFLPVCSSPDLANMGVVSGNYLGQVIHSPSIECEFNPTSTNIVDNQPVNYWGIDHILLKPGFQAWPGSVFRAAIWDGCQENELVGDEISESRKREEENPFAANGISISPNPFDQYVELQYTIETEEVISLSIYLYDLTGKQIKTILPPQKQTKGNFALTFDTSELAKGIYFLQMNTDGHPLSKKIVKAGDF